MTSQLKVDHISPATGSEIIIDGFGGGGLSSVQTFTSSGTWTKPSGISKVIVEVQGAGGSGSSSGTGANISGGGGGGYSRKFIDVSSISSATITVGSGGAGKSSGAGNDGGDSIWSDGTNTITANGGPGATIIEYDDTQGGSATGGDINITGGIGHAGGGNGSIGGGSILGSGGWGGWTGESNRILVGNGYGGGGGGGYNLPSGSGTEGIVIVTEYA